MIENWHFTSLIDDDDDNPNDFATPEAYLDYQKKKQQEAIQSELGLTPEEQNKMSTPEATDEDSNDCRISNYPRGIYFKDGKAVGASPYDGPHDEMHVIFLPSDHYDFLGPIDIMGKTKQELEDEAVRYHAQLMGLLLKEDGN